MNFRIDPLNEKIKNPYCDHLLIFFFLIPFLKSENLKYLQCKFEEIFRKWKRKNCCTNINRQIKREKKNGLTQS